VRSASLVVKMYVVDSSSETMSLLAHHNVKYGESMAKYIHHAGGIQEWIVDFCGIFVDSLRYCDFIQTTATSITTRTTPPIGLLKLVEASGRQEPRMFGSGNRHVTLKQ
jgi:hypothetical protein